VTDPAADDLSGARDGSAAHRRNEQGRESGSVTLVVLGFCLLLLTALAGVAAASSVYVTRRALSSIADGAAVAGADAVRESDVLGGASSEDLRLDGPAAQAAAARAIELSGAGSSLDDFAWSGQLGAGDREVVVTTSATADIPLATSLFGRGVTVTVTSRATGRT